jgi:hypothetical protein
VSKYEEGRTSFGYFCFPGIPDFDSTGNDCVITPIPKLITEVFKPTYIPFTYVEFFLNKMNKNPRSLLQTLTA